MLAMVRTTSRGRRRWGDDGTAATTNQAAQKIPVDPSARLSRGFEGHAVAEAFERVDSPAGDSLSVATVEVVRTRILIGPSVGEHMVDGSEHGVGDGDYRLLVTSAAKDPTIAGAERAVIRLNGRESGLRQRRPEPAIALPGLPGLVFAGAFVVAGADARPTREMPVARKDAHVHADLGDDHLRGATLDAVDGLKSGLFLGERRHQLLNPGAQGRHCLLEVIDVRHELCDQEGVMRAKSANQRLAEGGQLLAQ